MGRAFIKPKNCLPTLASVCRFQKPAIAGNKINLARVLRTRGNIKYQGARKRREEKFIVVACLERDYVPLSIVKHSCVDFRSFWILRSRNYILHLSRIVHYHFF